MKKNNKNKEKKQTRAEKEHHRGTDDYTVPNPMMDAEMPMRCLINKYFI